MEDHQISVVHNKTIKITSLLNYKMFSTKCFEKNIVDDKTLNNIEMQFETSNERLSALLEHITHSGYTSYRSLINVLIEYSHEILHLISELVKNA